MGAALYACCTAVEFKDAAKDPAIAQMLYEEVALLTLRELEAASETLSRYGCGTVPNQEHLRHQALLQRIEALIGELFSLQDLNSDGILDEGELVKLNEAIAMLHYGKDIDRAAIKQKYSNLFREQLDAEGRGVPVAIFRRYVLNVLDEVDPDPAAQEMILEQFIAEARSGIEIFRCNSFFSVADVAVDSGDSPHRKNWSHVEDAGPTAVTASRPKLRTAHSTRSQRTITICV